MPGTIYRYVKRKFRSKAGTDEDIGKNKNQAVKKQRDFRLMKGFSQ
jgi:hypothetical protein